MPLFIVFVCFRSSTDDLWRWHLRTNVGEVLAIGPQGYVSQEDCRASIVRAREALRFDGERGTNESPPLVSAGGTPIPGQATGNCRLPTETLLSGEPSAPSVAAIPVHRHDGEVCVAPAAG